MWFLICCATLHLSLGQHLKHHSPVVHSGSAKSFQSFTYFGRNHSPPTVSLPAATTTESIPDALFYASVTTEPHVTAVTPAPYSPPSPAPFVSLGIPKAPVLPSYTPLGLSYPTAAVGLADPTHQEIVSLPTTIAPKIAAKLYKPEQKPKHNFKPFVSLGGTARPSPTKYTPVHSTTPKYQPTHQLVFKAAQPIHKNAFPPTKPSIRYLKHPFIVKNTAKTENSIPVNFVSFGSQSQGNVNLGKFDIPVASGKVAQPESVGQVDDSGLGRFDISVQPSGSQREGNQDLGRFDISVDPKGQKPTGKTVEQSEISDLGRFDISVDPSGEAAQGRTGEQASNTGLGRFDISLQPSGPQTLGNQDLGRFDISVDPKGKKPIGKTVEQPEISDLGRFDISVDPSGKAAQGKTGEQASNTGLGRFDISVQTKGSQTQGNQDLGRFDISVDPSGQKPKGKSEQVENSDLGRFDISVDPSSRQQSKTKQSVDTSGQTSGLGRFDISVKSSNERTPRILVSNDEVNDVETSSETEIEITTTPTEINSMNTTNHLTAFKFDIDTPASTIIDDTLAEIRKHTPKVVSLLKKLESNRIVKRLLAQRDVDPCSILPKNLALTLENLSESVVEARDDLVNIIASAQKMKRQEDDFGVVILEASKALKATRPLIPIFENIFPVSESCESGIDAAIGGFETVGNSLDILASIPRLISSEVDTKNRLLQTGKASKILGKLARQLKSDGFTQLCINSSTYNGDVLLLMSKLLEGFKDIAATFDADSELSKLDKTVNIIRDGAELLNDLNFDEELRQQQDAKTITSDVECNTTLSDVSASLEAVADLVSVLDDDL